MRAESTRFCWPAPDAEGLAVLGEHDRVRGHGGAHGPGELQVVPLAGVGARCVTTHHVRAVRGDGIGRLHEQAAVDRSDVERVRARRLRREDPEVGLLRQRRQRLVVVGRGDDDLGEHGRQRRRGGRRQRPVDGDDAAERADRITRVGLLVGGRDVGGDGDAARVGVLDDDARRFVEAVHEAPRRLGVEQVEVAELLAAVLGDGVPPAAATDGAVARRLLVRVLAVAQVLDPLEAQRQCGRQLTGDLVGARHPHRRPRRRASRRSPCRTPRSRRTRRARRRRVDARALRMR